MGADDEPGADDEEVEPDRSEQDPERRIVRSARQRGEPEEAEGGGRDDETDPHAVRLDDQALRLTLGRRGRPR